MRIINLAENTEGAAGCGFEHGLCFYIETEHHKLLMDTGQSDLFIKNAEKLGVDLTKVDTVVLSHGHYDHGGGILPFAEINPDAKIYVQASAFGEYYSIDSKGQPHYIGLAEGIRELPQIVVVGSKPDSAEKEDAQSEVDTEGSFEDGIYRIDDELSLFTGIGNEHPIPSANQRLMKKTEGDMVQDDFSHEQCLVIHEGTKSVLLSGCAHHGILNILDRYRELYGGDPDVVISGFHMMKRHGYSDADITMIIDTALELRKLRTVFYTGHCTGVEPYNAMKKLMGDKLHYVHSGDEIRIRTKLERILWKVVDREPEVDLAYREAHRADEAQQEAKAVRKQNDHAAKAANRKRSAYMKCHKFFAWATVACFVMTMVTGYKRK
jgi:7,8-dihydropterin-6-yl-methyl-4-(beta-D-ribofuranosyl)aminobenzene 5'-phosphate synthase